LGRGQQRRDADVRGQVNETTLDTEVAAERTAEFEVPRDVPADVIAEVETTLLTMTTELRNEDICVDASVAMLATWRRRSMSWSRPTRCSRSRC
jgi:hypothetical protein